MDLNKDNVLKSIKSFIGADNELAIKEAEHQIKIFDVVYQKELLEYSEKDETKKDETLSPDKLEENILILEAIDNYKKEKTKVKEKKAKKEKIKIQSKEACPNFSFYSIFKSMISNKYIFGPILIIFGIFLCFMGNAFYNALAFISGILLV